MVYILLIHTNYYYYVKHSSCNRIIYNYKSSPAWAHALGMHYPQPRCTGAACLVACISSSLSFITGHVITELYDLSKIQDQVFVVVQVLVQSKLLVCWADSHMGLAINAGTVPASPHVSSEFLVAGKIELHSSCHLTSKSELIPCQGNTQLSHAKEDQLAIIKIFLFTL